MFTHPDNLISIHPSMIRQSHPDISFPPTISIEHVEELGYLAIEYDDQPELEPNEIAEPGEIRIEDGRAYQSWTVLQVPEPTIHEVTMRQARLALLQSELLHLVDPAIESMDEPARSAARIEWEYSQTIERQHTFVQQLGTALELSEEQVDSLFRLAASL